MPLTLVLSVGLDPALLATRNLVLQSSGYTVVPAISVREAVDRFRGGDFDLMVLCHSIPASDRGRLTCLIRASGSRIPVVTVSGMPYEQDVFADATVDEDPYKLLEGVEAALLHHARLWHTQMPGFHRWTETAARSAKEIMLGGGSERHSDRSADERSFGLRALAG